MYLTIHQRDKCVIKKLTHFLRIAIIAISWTVVYALMVNFVMSFFWQFDIFKLRYWKIISNFWGSGGVIDTASEIFFILALVAIIPLWILGWKKANKLSYVKIIFFPFFWYNNYLNKKYASEPNRIVIKNIGSNKNQKKQSPQEMMEEMIANRMPKAKDKKDLNSNKIRSNFEEKSRSFHQKSGSGS